MIANTNKSLRAAGLFLASALAASVLCVSGAQAQCQRQVAIIGYYTAKNYFGVAGCDGVEARDKEIREVCRVALGAAGRQYVRYEGLLTGSFHSPGNNTHCRFVSASEPGEAKTIGNAKSMGNPANITNVNCACVPTDCADGVDNDGDGATDFPGDFSCSDFLDNDEANPRSQCQDGVDNDGDGLTDLQDPGCGTRQDNNEGDRTSQCQDGADNDADGATDHPADFSCSSKTDNDETNPKAQCQDGVDNDSDGLVDLADPGCGGTQDNFEGDATSQCQDGVDNDGDGATDHPNDFSCSSKTDTDEANPKAQCQDAVDNDADGATDFPADFSCDGAQDNNETLPKAQCQDGVDNDNDGLTDTADPGCSGTQDNNEGDGTSQCQDLLDNDSDGATDFPGDFSCSSKTDGDEANPKAQCQDAVDNDSDGATDFPADFSCQSAQDNDELLPKSECQDGVDNDSDGLTDLSDPGCSNGQDNNEGDDPAKLAVEVACVMDNSDGSKSAYFSYHNATAQPILVPVGTTGSVTNSFSPGIADQGQPASFSPGIVRGVVSVPLSGSGVTWTVRAAGSAASSATASSSSPRCASVEPLIDCQGFENGELRAKGGYSNPNQFSVKIKYGPLNLFSPGTSNQGQPELFASGLNPGSFDVTLPSDSSSLVWDLNGKKITASSSLPVCAGECVDTPVGQVRGELDELAVELAQLTIDAANILAAAAPEEAMSRGDDRRSRRRRRAQAQADRTDAERAKAKARSYVDQSKALTIEFPDVIKNCPAAPQYCETVDRGETIDQLRALFVVSRNQAQRTIARAYFRETGATNRKDQLVKKAKQLETQGLANLNQLPRTETVCK